MRFLKKLFSILFSILIFTGILWLLYKRPPFFQRQINKVHAVYLVYRGDRAYKKFKLNKAINYYNYALRLYPEHYGAWYNLGNIYVVYEDYYSAVDAYEQAFEHNPKMIIARMNYGIVSAVSLGDFDGAINQYDAIINTKRHLISIPFVYSNRRSYKLNRGLAFYNKGVAYNQKSVYLDNEYETTRREYLLKALEAYKEACKILKRDYDARYNLALTNHLLGNYKDAMNDYCKAIKLEPMNYEAHYNLAVLLRHLKYYKESLDELKKATTLVSNSSTGTVSRQRYIFDVMNDVTRTILASADNELIEQLYEVPSEDSKVTYVNGRIVLTDDLDRAIMKNFSVCSAKVLLEDEEFEEGNDNYLRGSVNIPAE